MTATLEPSLKVFLIISMGHKAPGALGVPALSYDILGGTCGQDYLYQRSLLFQLLNPPPQTTTALYTDCPAIVEMDNQTNNIDPAILTMDNQTTNVDTVDRLVSKVLLILSRCSQQNTSSPPTLPYTKTMCSPTPITPQYTRTTMGVLEFSSISTSN